jgi:hypothetical protein
LPYIQNHLRKPALEIGPTNAGELNYKITEALIDYLETKGTTYQAINDILGALEGAKLEFYRRVAVPYERRKITDNGDVYTWGSGAVDDEVVAP